MPDGAHIDWPALAAFKRSFTDPVPQKRETGFKEQGIATFHGTARFTGRTTISGRTSDAVEAIWPRPGKKPYAG